MSRSRSRSRTAALLAAAALTLPGALSACGGDESASGTSSTVPAAEPYNDADLRFATGMIPHHAQALRMVDLTRGRDLDPEVERLASEILDAQGPEIQAMVGWLQDWDRPVPETERDHANAEDHGGHGDHGGDDGGSDAAMPGMMSAEDMSDLESAPDASFQDLWLQMMIEHHRGAIEMARTEQRDGEFADATTLAADIAAGQQQEIDRMRQLLPA